MRSAWLGVGVLVGLGLLGGEALGQQSPPPLPPPEPWPTATAPAPADAPPSADAPAAPAPGAPAGSAQPPPPGYGQPPQAMPPGGAPYYYPAQPGYYPPQGPPPPPPPPEEPKEKRNSTGAMVTGIVLTGLGGVMAIAGVVYVAAAEEIARDLEPFDANQRADAEDLVTGVGVGLLIGGGVAVAVGLPLLIWGAQKHPTEPPPQAAYAPELRVGPTGASLKLPF